MLNFCKVERVGGFCLVGLGDLGILLVIIQIGFTQNRNYSWITLVSMSGYSRTSEAYEMIILCR